MADEGLTDRIVAFDTKSGRTAAIDICGLVDGSNGALVVRIASGFPDIWLVVGPDAAHQLANSLMLRVRPGGTNATAG